MEDVFAGTWRTVEKGHPTIQQSILIVRTKGGLKVVLAIDRKLKFRTRHVNPPSSPSRFFGRTQLKSSVLLPRLSRKEPEKGP